MFAEAHLQHHKAELSTEEWVGLRENILIICTLALVMLQHRTIQHPLGHYLGDPCEPVLTKETYGESTWGYFLL